MAFARFQGVADEDEVIPSELIGDFIAGFEFKVPVGLALAWAKPGRGNVSVTFPRWDEMTGGVPAGTKGETDEFEERSIGMSESNIVPGMVGFAIKRSDEARAASPNGVEAGLLIEAINYLVDRMDDDVLSSVSSVTASQGLVTDVFDIARAQVAIAAYKLLKLRAGPLGHAAVLSHGMAAEFLASLTSTGATFPVNNGSMLQIGPEAGYLGRLYGFDWYESGGLPDSTTGKAGVMMPAGQRASALGAVVNELPNVETTRGDTMTISAAIQHVFRCWYGTGITNPRKGQQVQGAT